MAYLGSTQLSSVANPPILVAKALAGGVDNKITGGSTSLYVSNNYQTSTAGTPTPGRGLGQQLWLYHSTYMTTDVFVSGFFSDAGELGMLPGDIMMIVRQGSTVSSSQYMAFCLIQGITTAGAASVSTGSIISSSA